MNEFLRTDSNLRTLNSNCLCSVDIITTGKECIKHNMLEICILPLNANLEPRKGCLPFYMDIIPSRTLELQEQLNNKEDKLPFGINKERVYKAMQVGMDSSVAADRLDYWVNKTFNFKFGKKISLLTHDWTWKRDFVIDWIGRYHYDHYFDNRYRDLIPVALFLNDRAEFHVEPPKIPKYHLTYLCSQLKVDYDWAVHDARENARAITECYRKMMFENLH